MKAHAIAMLIVAGGLVTVAACSEESNEQPSPTTTTTPTTTTAAGGSGGAGATGGTTATGGAGGSTATGGAGGTSSGAESGVTIEVTHGATTEIVDLGTVTSFTCGEGQCVAVDDIVLAAFPELTLDSVAADFVASDGFNPESSANCSALVPVAGSDLDLGRVTALTRNLVWDDSLNFPGCLDVDDLAEIIITP